MSTKPSAGEGLGVPLHFAQTARAAVDPDEEVGPEELDGEPVRRKTAEKRPPAPPVEESQKPQSP